jgi:hypothetical protein
MEELITWLVDLVVSALSGMFMSYIVSAVGVIALIVIVSVGSGIATSMIMSRKGWSGCLGFTLGFFFPLLGVLIALFLRDLKREGR